MKKFRLLLLILLLFIITGCTIEIRKEINNEKEEETDNKIDGEGYISSIGVASDVTSPLNIGEYGIASKYNVYLNEYKDVDVSLKVIYEDPDSIIEDYNLANPDDLVEKQDGFKYVVLEYEVILFDFETASFGDNIRLDISVVDTDNNSFVVDGVKQVIETYILDEDLGIVNGGAGMVKVAFAIPEDIVNYLIKFGTYDHTIAYYKV